MSLYTDQCRACHRVIPAPGLCPGCDESRRACREALLSLLCGIAIAGCIALVVLTIFAVVGHSGGLIQ